MPSMRESTLRFEALDIALRSWVHDDAPPNPTKLLCFPYSGGGSRVFKPLAAALGPKWAVHGVNPRGHDLGAERAPLESVPEMVDEYISCLPPDLVEGAWVLGYSMGGYVAHHLVSRLEQDGGPQPSRLILCTVPPYERRHPDNVSQLDDKSLLASLTRLGGIPEGLVDAEYAFSLFAHMVRADFRAYEDCPIPEQSLRLPTLVIAATNDRIYRPEWFDEWTCFLDRATPGLVEGPHILLPDRAKQLADAIRAWA